MGVALDSTDNGLATQQPLPNIAVLGMIERAGELEAEFFKNPMRGIALGPGLRRDLERGIRLASEIDQCVRHGRREAAFLKVRKGKVSDLDFAFVRLARKSARS